MWINRNEYEKLKADSDKLNEKYDTMVIEDKKEDWKSHWEYASSECQRRDIIIKQLKMVVNDLRDDLEAEKEAHQRTSNTLFDLKVDYKVMEKELISLERKH